MDCGFVIYMQRSDCSGIAASHEKRGEGQRRGKGHPENFPYQGDRSEERRVGKECS